MRGASDKREIKVRTNSDGLPPAGVSDMKRVEISNNSRNIFKILGDFLWCD